MGGVRQMRWLRATALVLSLVLAVAADTASSQSSDPDPSPPAQPVKLVFVHHSTGGNWLADVAEHDYAGGLGYELAANNYYVSATNYGWGPGGIGDSTDIGHWWQWFRGPERDAIMAALYSEGGQNVGDFGSWTRRANDPGGDSEIVVIKSCFPNSHLGGRPSDPPTTGTNPMRGQANDFDTGGANYTVANAKGIYNDILQYFASRQDKLFVVITAPPLASDDMYFSTDASHAANARAFNNWLVNDWLSGYPHANVGVFDFFNVLTSNGGDPEVNDLGAVSGNHHRWRNGAEEHTQTVASNYAAYSMWLDSHPTAAGGRKATAELVPLLNVFYHRWRAAEASPTPTPTATVTPTPTPPALMPSPRRASRRCGSGGATPTPTPSPTPSPGALVTLSVTETEGVARVAEPVTSGVPLPAAAGIYDPVELRLVDSSGRVVPAQLTALARWGGALDDTSRPVKWLLLDFQTDIGSLDTVIYRLQQGGAAPLFPRLELTDSAAELRIDTGAVQWRLDRSDGALSAQSGGAEITGRARGADGTEYVTTGPVEVSVKHEGPMRASVQVRGSYRAADGSALVDYTSRFWFYAGSPLLRLFHTVENNTPCHIRPADGQPECYHIGSLGDVRLADLSLVIDSGLSGGLTFTAGTSGSPVTGSLGAALAIYQDSSGTAAWDLYATMTDWNGAPLDARPRMQAYTSFRGYRTTLGETTLDSGDQAPGWLAVAAGDQTWGVQVRQFWQSFPKALRATPDGTVEVGLFPDEYGPSDYAFTLRAGEHKTHEIWLGPRARLPATPLHAAAPAAWYLASDAVGLSAEVDRGAWPEHEDFVDYQLDTSPDYQGWFDWYPNLPTAIEALDFYGIFDFGDVPIDYEGFHVSPLNLKYNMDHGMWLQWLRGGDSRWFELAEAASRHVADIDILHNLHQPRHWSDGIMFGHSYHDEDGFTNPHRNEGGNHPDTMFGVPGLLTLYYLTGYEKGLESALEVADCIEYRLRNDAHLCPYFDQCNGEGWGLMDGIYDSGSRPAANALRILDAAYRATADPRYLEVADALVTWADPADQPYIGGPTGADMAVKPWLVNLYLHALGDYLELRSEFDLDAGQGGAFVARYADWLHQWAWLDLAAIASGERAAYPHEWWLDQRAANGAADVSNWLLLGADAMAYAHRITGDVRYLEWGERLFRAGSHDPWYEDDANTYSATKETANAVEWGHIFLHQWAESR